MSTATFGQLLSVADEWLKAAETDQSIIDPELGRDLLRMTRALRRIVDDRCARGDVAGLPRADTTLWEQAATELVATLRLAEDHLAGHVNVDDQEHAPTLLTQAADALAAADDLLRTHVSDQGGERSEWAEVIASGSVARALTEEMASWAQRLAPWVHWLGEQDSASARLLAASRSLRLAGHTTAVAGKAQPVTADDRTLLYAVPAARLPERLPPPDGEPVAELCAGIARTADRLRFIAFHAADRSAWSPAISARTWQYTATAAAVTMDTFAHVLRTLADSQTVPGTLLASMSGGMPQADNLIAARDAWQRIASALGSVTTDTPPELTPETTDLSDLVIRMGRIAFDNPRWTPQHPAEPRSAPSLFSSAADAANVLAAVHQGADALTAIANGHWLAVTTAIRAGRLYVPTRSLPERYNVPRRYAQMPPERAEELVGAYTAAARASAGAADSLSTIVLAVGGPSRHIALARHAIRREESPDFQAAAPSPAKTATPPGQRLAQRLAALGVADIDLVLRAAVIDKAAASLIGEADRRIRIEPATSSRQEDLARRQRQAPPDRKPVSPPRRGRRVS
jgi:hypothetical protein